MGGADDVLLLIRFFSRVSGTRDITAITVAERSGIAQVVDDLDKPAGDQPFGFRQGCIGR